MCVCLIVSDSLRSHGLKPTRLFSPWDFPSKNTGISCHFLLQWIFPTQGSNPHLLNLLVSCFGRWILPLCLLGNPPLAYYKPQYWITLVFSLRSWNRLSSRTETFVSDCCGRDLSYSNRTLSLLLS